MARFKMNDTDDAFLAVTSDASLIFAGAGGTETWIERNHDVVVRIGVKSVAVAVADGGSLEVCIDIDGRSARGQDGPAPIESQLRTSQGVQVLVKAGERLAFKAYPNAADAQVLRTIVWAADAPLPADANGAASSRTQSVHSAPPTAEPARA